MELFIFYMLSVIAIGSALLMVLMRNIARALFLFFVVLFAVAGLYIFALADFVALTQVLVYVGGVLILMLFAMMLSGKEWLQPMREGTTKLINLPSGQAFLVSILFLGLLSGVAYKLGSDMPQWMLDAEQQGQVIRAADNTVKQLGFALMTQYLLPFEVISILLMMALIGAAHLARKGSSL